ncbi:MAG: hypothetical protein LBT53_09290 [Puniceicoccales bacterium]|jgi:ribonuclease-3|nr:hypothetical protein [Puniceicoccales bacterium]
MSLRSRFQRFRLFLQKLLRPERAAEFAALEQQTGHTFRNPALLRTALTHPSATHWRRENGGGAAAGGASAAVGSCENYQRMEFLGDAVLSLVLAESLYVAAGAGEADEGFLTDARTRVVCGRNLAAAGKRLGLGKLMFVAPSGDMRRIREADSVHEDMLEAFFGAVFLDGGLPAARRVAQRLFGGEMGDACSARSVAESRSAKCKLQECVQSDGRPNEGQRIEYRTVAQNGPPHLRNFVIEVWVDGQKRGTGEAKTKRLAGEIAAAAALPLLAKNTPPEAG